MSPTALSATLPTVHSLSPRLGALLLALGLPATAHADERCQPDDGLSTCVSSDNLWPQPGGGHFVSQASTQLPEGLALTGGLVPTYLLRPIGFEVASPDPEGATIYAVEHVLASHVIAAASYERLQLQLVAPFFLYQKGAGKSDVVGAEEELPTSAMGDLRFGVQATILRRAAGEDGLGISGRFEMSAPTSAVDTYAGFGSATWAPALAADYRIGRVVAGVDVGGRFREDVHIAGAFIGSQLSASLGASVDILDDGWLSAAGEVWALFTLLQQQQIVSEPGSLDRDVLTAPPHIPTEWMVSLRTAALLDGRLRIRLGGGGLIPTASHTAVTSPLFRGVLGLHYVHGLGDG